MHSWNIWRRYTFKKLGQRRKIKCLAQCFFLFNHHCVMKYWESLEQDRIFIEEITLECALVLQHRGQVWICCLAWGMEGGRELRDGWEEKRKAKREETEPGIALALCNDFWFLWEWAHSNRQRESIYSQKALTLDTDILKERKKTKWEQLKRGTMVL